MTTAAEDQLAKARARLVETLSGCKQSPQKLNAAPTLSNGYEEFAAVIKHNSAAQTKLNASKRELTETLSYGLKHDGYDDGVVVMEIPHDQIVKQAAAKALLRWNLSGRRAKWQEKQNQRAPNDTSDDDDRPSTGITSVVKSSADTNTDFGQAFYAPEHPVTRHHGQITYDDLKDFEDSDSDSSVPAIRSGQRVNPNGDYAPGQTEGSDFSAAANFDQEKSASDLLNNYTNSNGKIDKNARSYFGNVINDGSQRDHYFLALGSIDPASQQPVYNQKGLSEAFSAASGVYNGAVNRLMQLRILRIAKRNNMVTPEMQEFEDRQVSQ